MNILNKILSRLISAEKLKESGRGKGTKNEAFTRLMWVTRKNRGAVS